jgi:hypothetical protein
MRGMERQRNSLAVKLIALLLILAASTYVAGYFAVSEVRQMPMKDIRVFDSEIAYILYVPMHTVDARFTGREMHFSD